MLKKIIKQTPGAKQMARNLGFISKPASSRQFLFDILPKNLIGAEIGVHLGDFSQQIIDYNSPKELNLIDPWKYETSNQYQHALYGGQAKAGQKEMDQRFSDVCHRFSQEIQDQQVKIHRESSKHVLEKFADEYLDWIYIDGNHCYQYIKQDLELSFQKTKPGGWITGDDYTEGGWWQGGVKKAVDEFLKNEAIQLIKIKNGQFILRKK